MARKNIFQLIEESYNIQNEIRKIDELFTTADCFEAGYQTYSFCTVIDSFLFEKWKLRGTCLDVDECFERANATISRSPQFPATENEIINDLELLENFIKLYYDYKDELFAFHGISPTSAFEKTFCRLVFTLEKRMGLVTRNYKDGVVLYPKHAPLEKVIDLCIDEDVQWELIRYVREDLSLAEKRKSLAYLATNLNIEDNAATDDAVIKSIIGKATNILNNLHIRHNNQTGKYESQTLKELPKKDAIALCDMVYNEMLTIVLLRDHRTYEATYSEFTKKQREEKTQKKAEGK